MQREGSTEGSASRDGDHKQSDEDGRNDGPAYGRLGSAAKANENPAERKGYPCRRQPRDDARVRVGVQRANVEVVELEIDELGNDLRERYGDSRSQPDTYLAARAHTRPGSCRIGPHAGTVTGLRPRANWSIV